MKKRMVLDLAMAVLLPLLMAYSLIGETFHEIAGTAMLVLFICHHILNRGWYKGLLRRKRTPANLFRAIINMALLIFMILQPLSGILMSKHLYTFIDVPGAASPARAVHILLAYWGFVIMSVHAGTHLTAPIRRLKKASKSKLKTVMLVWTAASLYGIYAFVKRGFPEYMFLRSAFVFFDYSEPRIYFFLDYIAIMILFMLVGYRCVLGKETGDEDLSPSTEDRK